MCVYFFLVYAYKIVLFGLNCCSSSCAPFICLTALSLNYLVGFIFKLKLYLLLLLCMSTAGHVPAMVWWGQRTTAGAGSCLLQWAVWVELRGSCLHIACF